MDTKGTGNLRVLAKLGSSAARTEQIQPRGRRQPVAPPSIALAGVSVCRRRDWVLEGGSCHNGMPASQRLFWCHCCFVLLALYARSISRSRCFCFKFDGDGSCVSLSFLLIADYTTAGICNNGLGPNGVSSIAHYLHCIPTQTQPACISYLSEHISLRRRP